MTSTTGGESSAVVSHSAVTSRTTAVGVVRLRSAFSITSRRSIDGSEIHLITAPKHGRDRAQARRATVAVLHHAQQNHHRVTFLITLSDYTRYHLNAQHGYDAAVVLMQCQIEYDDPFAWLQRQLPRNFHTTSNNYIIGVTITTWPRAGSVGS